MVLCTLSSNAMIVMRTYANDGIARLFERRRAQMPGAEIGWIAAIIIGGLAGWLAEMFMKSDTGIFTNIILGIIGAALANWLLGMFSIAIGGWIGYLIAGFIGACIIIALWRVIRGRRA
jgi:uncharacterized membrane protein YeaQ/YmgE (transglycosylase-associated protein family)